MTRDHYAEALERDLELRQRALDELVRGRLSYPRAEYVELLRRATIEVAVAREQWMQRIGWSVPTQCP